MTTKFCLGKIHILRTECFFKKLTQNVFYDVVLHYPITNEEVTSVSGIPLFFTYNIFSFLSLRLFFKYAFMFYILNRRPHYFNGHFIKVLPKRNYEKLHPLYKLHCETFKFYTLKPKILRDVCIWFFGKYKNT